MYLDNIELYGKIDLDKLCENELFEKDGEKVSIAEDNYMKYIEEIVEPIQKAIIEGFVDITIVLGCDDEKMYGDVERYFITKSCVIFVDPLGMFSELNGNTGCEWLDSIRGILDKEIKEECSKKLKNINSIYKLG